MYIFDAPWVLPVCLISVFIYICCLINDTRERLSPRDFDLAGNFLWVLVGFVAFIVMMTSSGQTQITAMAVFGVLVVSGGLVATMRGDFTMFGGLFGHSFARFLLGLFFR